MRWSTPYMGVLYLFIPVAVAVSILIDPSPIIPAVAMPASIVPFVAWSWHRDAIRAE